jgi:hypothetical protein
MMQDFIDCQIKNTLRDKGIKTDFQEETYSSGRISRKVMNKCRSVAKNPKSGKCSEWFCGKSEK